MSVRGDYCRSIQQVLVTYCGSLRVDGGGNLQDESIYAENIFRSILNEVYGWDLLNANATEFNNSGFDLIDRDRNILIQVSKDSSSGKIQSTLERLGKRAFPEPRRIKFMFLVEEAPKYKVMFSPTQSFVFDVKQDVISIKTLMADIRDLPIERLRRVYDLVNQEIGITPNVKRIPTCLGRIVKALIPAALNEPAPVGEVVAFRIDDKIVTNALETRRHRIAEYASYTHLLTGLYSAYDAEGCNDGRLLLQSLPADYDLAAKDSSDPSSIFDNLLDILLDRLDADGSLSDIDFEMRRHCVEIILVDAFMRCRIFKGPDVRVS